MISAFINAGRDELVLPLMQGFVGQRAFSISQTDGTENDVVADAAQETKDVLTAQSAESDQVKANEESNTDKFLLTLISRRSIKRAGLRYLRRGADDEGNVANYVETEQILSTQSWDSSDKSFSLIQVRGSIPLHFSQSPYSFKPTPVIFGPESANQAAFNKHFASLTKRFGSVQVVSLIDKHGPEVGAGEAYENYMERLNSSGGANGNTVGFEWFDFHTACKGMKFENISILIDAIKNTLSSYGWIVKQDDRNTRLQSGVVRTNCMDCLDRSNVVQAAVATWALQRQLAELGLQIDLQADPTTQWFNTLWADNGDAMSRQYAGTAALKSDFTRTRKRNWTGALADFSKSLNRYYNNVFGDYFLQTCLDYYLGNAGPGIFDEFESDMMSKDFALDIVRIRANAIETCIKIVLEDPIDHLVAGWTLSCPQDTNTLRTFPFEECVVLLTNACFYSCRFDWNTEKVNSFERVDLLDIGEIFRGAYIISTLGPTHLDESKNVGFALRYKPSSKSIVRTNTRGFQSESETARENEEEDEPDKQKEPEKVEDKLLAFKALPPEVSAVKNESEEIASKGEVELVKHICEEIHKAIEVAARKQHGATKLQTEDIPQLSEKDVLSAADARKNTGYMESIGYSLKRLVWS